MHIFHITSVFFAFVSHCKPCPAASVPPAPGCLPQPATLEPKPSSQVLFSTNYIRTNPFAFILMLFTDSGVCSAGAPAIISTPAAHVHASHLEESGKQHSGWISTSLSTASGLRLPGTFCALLHTSMSKERRSPCGQIAATIQQPHEFSA